MFGLIGVFGKEKKKTKICIYLDGTSAGRWVGWEFINFLYHIIINYISHVYL